MTDDSGLACRHCGVPQCFAPVGFHADFCATRIEAIREFARCHDCNSVVTVVVAIGAPVFAPMLHDRTCPSWRVTKAEWGLAPGEGTNPAPRSMPPTPPWKAAP